MLRRRRSMTAPSPMMQGELIIRSAPWVWFTRCSFVPNQLTELYLLALSHRQSISCDTSIGFFTASPIAPWCENPAWQCLDQFLLRNKPLHDLENESRHCVLR